MHRGLRQLGLLTGLPVLLSLALWSSGAAAQNATPSVVPSTVEPGRDRPAPEALPQGDFQITVPAPRRTPVRRSVDDLKFRVQMFVLPGLHDAFWNQGMPMGMDALNAPVKLYFCHVYQFVPFQ